MKVNDIFEREFDGDVLRFQLTELNPHKVCIELMNDSIGIDKDICSHLAPPFPVFEFAFREKGDFVTTKEGNNEIEKLTVEIFERIKKWRSSLQWVRSNTSLKKDVAEDLVTKMYAALKPRFHDRYLPAVVRWACYGEIDPDNETDIVRMSELISSYHDHLTIRNRETIAKVGYKVEFDDNGFKRFNVDGTEIRLVKMKETEEALRSWLNA